MVVTGAGQHTRRSQRLAQTCPPRPPSTWGTLAPRAPVLLASSRVLPQRGPAPAPTDSHRQARAGGAGPGTKGAARRAPSACHTPACPKPPPSAPQGRQQRASGRGGGDTFLPRG